MITGSPAYPKRALAERPRLRYTDAEYRQRRQQLAREWYHKQMLDPELNRKRAGYCRQRRADCSRAQKYIRLQFYFVRLLWVLLPIEMIQDCTHRRGRMHFYKPTIPEIIAMLEAREKDQLQHRLFLGTPLSLTPLCRFTAPESPCIDLGVLKSCCTPRCETRKHVAIKMLKTLLQHRASTESPRLHDFSPDTA